MNSNESLALVVDVGRALLAHIHKASHEDALLITYGDLAGKLPYEFNPRKLDSPLWELSSLCEEMNLPLISTLVVNQDTLMPGIGYFKAFFPDTRTEMQRISVFTDEFKRAAECKDWRPLAEALGL